MLLELAQVPDLVAGELRLSWKDNANNEEGFEVERSMDGEAFRLISTLGPDSEGFTDESIVPGLEYQYRVRAYNSFGYSAYTNVSSGLAANTAPVVGDIGDVTILRGESMPSIGFDISDSESPSDELVVDVISSNLALVSLDGVSVTLDGAKGTVIVSPKSSEIGASVVSILVSDGAAVSQRDFNVTVSQNYAPTIGSLKSVSAFDGQSVGPINVRVSDSETDADALSVSASSTDEELISSENIFVSGSGEERQIVFRSNEGVTGDAVIKISVSDGVNVTNGALLVEVLSDHAPTIEGLEAQYAIQEGSSIDGLGFVVSDVETAASDLEVTVSSSNAAIVSVAGLDLGGIASERSLSIAPSAGASGTAVVTVSVSDGIKSTSRSFTLTVLGPDAVVTIVDFSIVDGLAAIEVENRGEATFSLWKIHSSEGAWRVLEDVEVIPGLETTTLIDPSPIDEAVCYRVIASE